MSLILPKPAAPRFACASPAEPQDGSSTPVPGLVGNSYRDGIFASMFATLTGGVFLTGFALYLGMGVGAIGLLAASPYIATLFQLPASLVIARRGRQKSLAVGNAVAGRLLWLLILAVGLLPLGPPSVRIAAVLILVFFSHAFISVSHVAWLSWVSDLVPAGRLGRFFGTRNMLNGLAGMVTIVVFGWLLERMTAASKQDAAFAVVFAAAVFCGMTSIGFMRKVPAPPPPMGNVQASPLHLIRGPLKTAHFRRFLVYDVAWSFSVYLASPFFTLYFLQELRFSYAFVAFTAMIAAFADLSAMRLWGVISDRIPNHAVISGCSAVVVFLPLLWTLVDASDRLLPIGLHVLGGVFWAGIHLCTNNMVIRMVPREDRAVGLSLHNIAAGLGAALAPVAAGFAAEWLEAGRLSLWAVALAPLQTLFLASTALRMASLLLLRRVHEPAVVPDQRVIRVLRNVRGLNAANGFNGVLHPFVPAPHAAGKAKPSSPAERGRGSAAVPDRRG